MHKQKLENLISLNNEERFDYFIREAVQFEEVWVLAKPEGYIFFKDHEGDDVFPVWPHEELADACRFEEHKSNDIKPESIELRVFIKQCIPDMVSNQIYFGIFYNRNRTGIAIAGNELKMELEAQYEEIFGSDED